jgi:hypothetical protein
MGSIKRVNEVASNDSLIRKYRSVYKRVLLLNPQDLNHLERRRQQRAISEEMIDIALCYGYRKRIRGAITFTLTDKSLKGSPYERYMDSLRGLKVVTQIEGKEVYLQTCYWSWSIKNKKRI